MTPTTNKIHPSAAEAVGAIGDGASIALGGFVHTGAPLHLMRAVVASSVADVEIVCNNGGLFPWSLGPLLSQGRVRRIIASHIGGNKELEAAFRRGEIEVELVPQGTFAERLRAGGAGIPAFYTASGVDTLLETGMPWRYHPDGSVALCGPPKERREFDGRAYILETAIRPDVALVHARYGDPLGNLVYNESARNFNPDVAMAGRVTIAEVEHLVAPGELDPAAVHTPGIFVDRVVEVGPEGKWHERLVTRGATSDQAATGDDPRHVIARRVAAELQPGEYVNLGTGIPTLVRRYLSDDTQVQLHSENGIVGLGPPPATAEEASFDLINASKETATVIPGGSFSDSATSFGMIRGGHVDVSVLGAMQVSEGGDIANWMVPGRTVAGMGGAMDLVAGARRVVAAMAHTDDRGRPKIVRECSFPLTGKGVVDRVITDLAVLDVTPDGLVLRELAPGVSVEQVLAATAAPVAVPRPPGPMLAPE